MWLKYAQQIDDINAPWSRLFDDTGLEHKIESIHHNLAIRIPEIEANWGDVLHLLTPPSRLLAVLILLRGHQHHFTFPSSRTGKYHPPDERSIGGQIIHEKKVAGQMLNIMRLMGLSRGTPEYDAALMSVMVHDMAKFGIPASLADDEDIDWGQLAQRIGERVDKSNITHDVDMLHIISRIAPKLIHVVSHDSPELAESLFQVAEMVKSGVANHSGPWRSDIKEFNGKQLSKEEIIEYHQAMRQQNIVNFMVHISDYVASRALGPDDEPHHELPDMSRNDVEIIQSSIPELSSEYIVRDKNSADNIIQDEYNPQV